MEQKPWYQSKVIWINVITFTALALSLPEVGTIVPNAAAKFVSALSALLNLWLRVNTAQPLGK